MILLFSCPVVFNSLGLHGLQHARSLSLTISQSLPSSRPLHLRCHQASHPLTPSSAFALNLSHHQALFQLAVHIRSAKYWSFSFSISPSNEYSGLISLKIDYFDLVSQSLSGVRLFATPWTVARQLLRLWDFLAKNTGVLLPFPSPVHLPDPGIEPGSPTLQVQALYHLSHQGDPGGV